MTHGLRGALALVFSALLLGACAEANDQSVAGAEPPRLGLLRVVPDEDHAAFLGELRSRDWRPGDNVKLLPEDPETIYPTLEEARAALDAWREDDVDLVVAFSTPFARLLADEAPDTPGLFLVNDPVAAGLVTDPDRPDGSLTGVSFRTPADRTLALADQALGGGLQRIGYLWPADDPAVPGHREAVAAAARDMGFEVVDVSFGSASEVPAAIDLLAGEDVDVVFLATSTDTVRALGAIESELERVSLPAIANTDFAHFAVVVLTPDGAELRRQLARQAARLLSGADVSAVPVEDPRKFLTVVNRSQLQALGLAAPPEALLRQADAVR